MWGTRAISESVDDLLRFIPTHVGNTPSRPAQMPPDTVHPHACGEHAAFATSTDTPPGSSPRMWGTQFDDQETRNPHRFIPTHVGNTTSGSNRIIRSSVHPHACGEHDARPCPCGSGLGSSPRMWGTPNGVYEDEEIARFIPTHVGNT